MATYNFLDKTGLGLVWAKIKALIPTKTSDLTNDSGYTTNSGTVTSVATGTGLSGGTITSSGTISHNDIETTTAVSTAGLKKITTDGIGHIKTTVNVAKSDITELGIPAQDTNYSISISGNVITLTGSDSSTSTVTLPVYNGGVVTST